MLNSHRGVVAQIIDGKRVAAEICAGLKARGEVFKGRFGRVPGLATILVGEDPASQVYVKNKIAATRECGMESFHVSHPATLTQAVLLDEIRALNSDPKVHGILVQLPLPKHIAPQAVLDTIDPLKDVDGFHPQNLGLLTIGRPRLEPCTPRGVIRLLDYYKIEIAGRDAVVVGRSNIVGKPVALMLVNRSATVTVAHSKTRDLAARVYAADIVIAAVGQPALIRGDWIKPGAVVIDVAINRGVSGKLCGDVEFENAKERAGWITPVPGGVGPMTIAMLMENTLMAASLQQGLSS